MTNTVYLSVTETAKRVRVTLKGAFPTITFSVRSHSYSGGASIDVRWTNGPTSKAVEQIVNQFEGATFDGMSDLKSYQTHLVNSERIQYGADFIFTHRRITREFLMAVVQTYCTHFRCDIPPITVSGSEHADVDIRHPLHDPVRELLSRLDECDLTHLEEIMVRR